MTVVSAGESYVEPAVSGLASLIAAHPRFVWRFRDNAHRT